MSTLPPPATKKFPENSIESQVYKIVEELKEYLPVLNDRNRLGFSLCMFIKGEGDKPDVLVNNLKMVIKNISPEKLVEKINSGLSEIKK